MIDQTSDNLKSVIGSGSDAEEEKTGGALPEEMSFATEIRSLIIRDKLRLKDSIEKAEYMIRATQIKSNLQCSIQ
jgi:hypothetical protein